MGLSVSTAHRLARTLVSAAFLEQDDHTARYRLGPAVAELGQLTFHQRGLHLAAPELDLLSRRTGAAADLAIRSGPHAVILVGASVRPDTGLGLRRPLHSTALGKVLLAWPRPGDAGVATLGPLAPFTDRTITAPAAPGGGAGEGPGGRSRPQRRRVGDRGAHGRRTGAGRRHQARFALAVRSTPVHLTDERLEWFLDHARACAGALAVLLLPPDQRI